MAPVRYSKTVPEPDRVLTEISRTRDEMLTASRGVRPYGPAYHALSMVMAAIDGLAAFMTGERHYFATRMRGSVPHPTAAPGLNLDESPDAGPEELDRFQPKE